MSKLYVKVRLCQADAAYLVGAFFKNFNPQNSMMLNEDIAELEMEVGDYGISEEMLESICDGEIVEMRYPMQFEITEKTKTEPEEVGESAYSEQAELELEQSKNDEPVDEKVVKKTRVKMAEVPKLNEIAEKATSFDEFEKSVAEWLEMGKYTKIFENLVAIAISLETLCWKDIENAFKNKGVKFGQYDRMKISEQVSNKLDITLLQLLNAMSKYSFEKEKGKDKAAVNVNT